MRTRTVLATGLVGLLAVSSFQAADAKPKKKPKPITMTYTATGVPDPTSTNPVTNEICAPTNPAAMYSQAFTVPAAGTLEVSLGNMLDWSLAVRAGGESLATSDGGTPTDHEAAFVSFKKKTVISIDTCNFAGEPTIPVTFTFIYK